ncbi:MAG: heme-binding protein [Crocinitomicaceae bacterium]|nr:heme-binding protein [Crocinitomicaceae bacterium]
MTSSSYFFSVAFVVLMLSQLFMAYKTSKIESPSYKVIKSFEDFEIRNYDAMVVAKTEIRSEAYEESSSSGFRTIANYIFGGNKENQQIAMTSPVIMEMGEKSSMSFVMPEEHAIENLPEPNSKNVEIIQIQPKTYAVLEFTGYANDKKIKKHTKRLLQFMKAENLMPIGTIKYLGYNPPWQVLGRKNEVAVEVDYSNP